MLQLNDMHIYTEIKGRIWIDYLVNTFIFAALVEYYYNLGSKLYTHV